jgi:hypothetical protein
MRGRRTTASRRYRGRMVLASISGLLIPVVVILAALVLLAILLRSA